MAQKKKQNTRIIRSLTIFCLVLVSGVGYLLNDLCSPGISTVSKIHGSVLLQNSASSYVIIGILAFILGVAVTILCIKIKKRNDLSTKEKEHIS